jgi:hypothetical protein
MWHFKKLTLMIRYLMIILLIYCLISCGQINSKQTKLGLLKVDTSIIAILPYDKTDKWLFKDCNPTELTSKDIDDIEMILTKCIDEYNPEQEKQFIDINSKHPEFKLDRNNFIIDLKRYKRQYIAVINSKGEKEVWINCFCSAWSGNWKAQQIQVEDGGNCFFNLKINLKTRNYYDFSVNGEA